MCASRDIQQRSPQSSFRQTSEHGARRDDAQPWMIAKVSTRERRKDTCANLDNGSRIAVRDGGGGTPMTCDGARHVRGRVAVPSTVHRVLEGCVADHIAATAHSTESEALRRERTRSARIRLSSLLVSEREKPTLRRR